MSTPHLDQYRKVLLDKRADLLDRVRAVRSTDPESTGGGSPDLGDRALSTMTRELQFSLSTSEREVLRRIDAALDRIDAGTYGECVHCGNEVQVGRLEAVPWALHCFECQELQDRGEI